MAVDTFLKLDGIKGESGDYEYPGSIDVLSFSWRISHAGASGTGGGSGTGKVDVHDISITKFVGKHSSPALLRLAANGRHIPDGMIIVRQAGDKHVYKRFKLGDIKVKGVQFAGHDKGQLTENCATFKVES